ncbi:MAG: Rieske 2Fe-2S domain-containing protein [Desulfovibrio sp.]|jgi:succinate dehydrogenase / fumarate reductase iron-sulfur subunit|nr:Rieske 2Fe-2S domain-containing protein [Desulfovibrio sp.]
MEPGANQRTVRIFRYNPEKSDEGSFQDYSLTIDKPEITTILDVLIRIQNELDPSIAFRFACRVNMCGSCGMVINGCEALACKTNVSDLPPKQDITLRPLNHFPVIKDLVVDMGPFFSKYEDALPFFEPLEKREEPYVIKPDTRERIDIAMATDCIACGCCVSSCTMVNNHADYSGPAALNRAFTLLADKRDALFIPRLTRALESCYACRTEFNCTEVCPKQISGTRAIKYIQRLAVRHLSAIRPLPAHPAEKQQEPNPPAAEHASDGHCSDYNSNLADPSRRCFLKSATGVVGAGVALSLAGVLGVSSVAPTLSKQPSQWVPAGDVSSFAIGSINTVMLRYERRQAFHSEPINFPVLIRRDSEQDFVCFSSSCPHLGCSVFWEQLTDRFRCACHGGAFDRNGNVIAGPPPNPLSRLPWKIKNGVIKVEVV